jgi:hypothetical protein
VFAMRVLTTPSSPHADRERELTIMMGARVLPTTTATTRPRITPKTCGATNPMSPGAVASALYFVAVSSVMDHHGTALKMASSTALYRSTAASQPHNSPQGVVVVDSRASPPSAVAAFRPP